MIETITAILNEIEERAKTAASTRSDDFGHDTTKLSQWSMQELEAFASTEVPRLLLVVKNLIEHVQMYEKICDVKGSPGSRDYWHSIQLLLERGDV